MEPQAKLPWKKRTDLVITFSRERGEGSYVVKDPLSLQYFSLSRVEYFVLEALDGTASLNTLRERLYSRFPENDYTLETIKLFLSTLIGSNLLVSTALGYGKMLATRVQRRERHSSRWISRFNFITLRWRGIDPNRFLKWLDAYLGWIYTTPILIGFILLFLAAIVTFFIQSSWNHLSANALQSLFSIQNVPFLLISIVLVKLLHEFGHGLTCVHYGGECHELGVLFIAFCPLPYCDTTDSWLHESRWNRALVAAAGIVVEVAIASICCLLWSVTVPGVLHLMLFNIMLICSINTLLVNGNPLMRYDGYYVLSDALNYPNLGPEARRLASQWFESVVYGARLTSDVALSVKRIPLALYGAASGAYRIFVMVMILWAIHQLLKNYELSSLTIVLVFPMVASLSMALLTGVVRRGQALAQSNESAGRRRAFTGMACFLAIVGLVLFFPWPYTVTAPFSLEPGTCQPVFVTMPGRLQLAVSPDASVQQDQIIAQLSNPAIALAVDRTESELAQRELHLKNLQSYRSYSPIANSTIPAAEESLQIAKERAISERQRLARLAIRSPIAGQVYPARNVPEQHQPGRHARFWVETVLDPRNKSAWLGEQTLVGWVGSPADFQAVVYVPQHLMAFVRDSAKTRLVFLSAPNTPCVGRVVEVGNEVVDVAPREVFQNKLLVADPTLGLFHSSETRYRVRVSLENGNPGPLYSTGLAKIECTPVSFFNRFWRSLSHAFAVDF